MSAGRFDAFVVVIARFNYLKAEFLIEVYGTFVVHLDVSVVLNGERETDERRKR